MLVINLVVGFLEVTLLLVAIYLLGRPIIRGAIYFPTSSRGVGVMMKLADVRPGQSVVDLGSGDGRVLIEAAKHGARAVGYEINPILVWRSRRAIARAGFASRATVHWESFWGINLPEFDVVIVYGIPYIMRDLQKKLERELRPDTKIISNAFVFPGWEPIAEENKILLYKKPAGRSAG